MKPGKYWIGDLCYVLDEVWDEVCDLIFADEDHMSGEYTLKDGRRFCYSSTMWGDGLYHDQHGNRYGVDAGLIGAILVEDLPNGPSSLGAVHTFNKEWEMDVIDKEERRSAWDGVIRFGPLHEEVQIPTD